MDDHAVINILGDEISCTYQMIPIDNLRYLETNPRVYSSIYGKSKPDDPDELQDLIEKQMLNEPSVKNLIPRIKKHGGLQEPILVRWDTMQVIEGNSRLTAYKILDKSDKENKGKWENIHCQVVSALSDKQQYAFLNQVHVEGKTPWVTYEKANQAYIMKEKDNFSEEEITETLSITKLELAKRIRVIQLMEDNKDKDRSHFSHYNVLVRTRKIAEELATNPYLENILVSKIKAQGKEGTSDPEFNAQDLRDKLPSLIAKKKVLKRYMDGKVTLFEAYQSARISGPHQNIKYALEKIQDIEKIDISNLDKAQLNAAFISIKNLCKESERMKAIILEHINS